MTGWYFNMLLFSFKRRTLATMGVHYSAQKLIWIAGQGLIQFRRTQSGQSFIINWISMEIKKCWSFGQMSVTSRLLKALSIIPVIHHQRKRGTKVSFPEWKPPDVKGSWASLLPSNKCQLLASSILAPPLYATLRMAHAWARHDKAVRWPLACASHAMWCNRVLLITFWNPSLIVGNGHHKRTQGVESWGSGQCVGGGTWTRKLENYPHW